MVALALAVAGPSLGLEGAALVAAGLLAAYIDSTVTYPGLFGKKAGSKPDSLEGFQISTTDPGAPRWDVYGSRAWVPCHFLWTLGVKEETSGGGTGKGGRPFVSHVRADVGIGLCDGPVADTMDLYADERPFWSKQFNRVSMEDPTWQISAGVGLSSGRLVIRTVDYTAADFSGLFRGDVSNGDICRLERVYPASLNGYYRAVAVKPHGGSDNSPSRIDLLPLQGQTPAAGVAGSAFDPPILRRIDHGNATADWTITVQAGNQIQMLSIDSNGQHHFSDPPWALTLQDYTLARRWQSGAVYRFMGMSPSTWDGLWQCIEFTLVLSGHLVLVRFTPLEGQGGSAPSPGTSTDPVVIERVETGGFVFYDAQQDWAEYRGTDDQPSDPTLAIYEDSPPAHRGIAHLSLSNWSLAPHGNIIPRVTGMVRARPGETAAAAIHRMCTKAMPSDAVDSTHIPRRVCLGYSVPGGTTTGQKLQPMLTAYGLNVQDRGGVITFLDRRDLPVVPVPTRHLNARPPTEVSKSRGFVASRIDPIDVPERVLVQYLDPAEGANEAEGDGRRSPGDPERGSSDTLIINLKPLVMWGYEAKALARQIRRELTLETYRGQVRLPPGYMDVLPGHCLTFASNDEEFDAAPAGPTIAYDTHLRDLLPGSVAVRVRFSGGQVATLLDNGAGALEGFPAGITTFTNTVDYGAGRIELLCSEALDTNFAPQITYRYDRQWLMRATKATLGGYDFGVSCDLLTTTTDEPLPPVPRRISSGLGAAIVSAVPPYRSHVLDIPSLQPGMSNAIWVGFAAAPEPSAPWRGATVYQSPNGEDRWTAVGQIQTPTIIGTAQGSALPTRVLGARPGVIDWSTELSIDLPNGETLDSVTTEMLGYGLNWALVGDEIIAFHEAEAQTGTQWILRGLWRARRHTHGAMDTHVDGERFVLLTNLGGMHGLLHEIPGGYAAAHRTYYWRVVPGGASVTAVETIATTVDGKSARPPAPHISQADVSQVVGSHTEVRWWRRSREMPPLFGPATLPNGWVEKYEVIAFDAIAALSLVPTLGIEGAIQASKKRRWLVGDELMGTPNVERRIEYDEADMTGEDGFVLGLSVIGFVVYQIGPTGRSEPSDLALFVPSS